MKKLLTTTLIVVTLICCTRAAVGLKGNLMRKMYQITSYTNEDKNLAFLGVMHLNKQEYFDQIAKDIDSLRNEGYVIFYEGIKKDIDLTDADRDMYQRKIRKILGFHFTSYLDETNKDMKKFKVKGYVHQTLSNTGIDATKDINADYNIKGIIDEFERRRGEIILSNCDLNTPLGVKYSCGKKNQADFDFLTITLRDSLVVSMIQNSEAKKIALLYGDMHRYTMFNKLKAQDSTWRFVRRKAQN
ncbi:MAG: hypothetical protein ACK4UK_01800 [Flavobacterium sp.]